MARSGGAKAPGGEKSRVTRFTVAMVRSPRWVVYRALPTLVVEISPTVLLEQKPATVVVCHPRLSKKGISQILRLDTGSTGAVATPSGTSAFARDFGPCPAWVPPVVGADKGHAAVLRLRDGRQRTRRHDHVRPVPWQPELSDYSGRSHTDLPDASSVKPTVPLDAADACCDVLRTNREHRQHSKYRGLLPVDPRAHVSPVIRLIAPVYRWMPRSLGPFLRLPLRRISRVRQPVICYVPQ
ncbi:hypothetical protein MRX96_057258 [Rhipicephalus microplus]